MTEKKSLKDQIKTIDDLEKTIIPVPVWGNVKIEIRSMSGGARAQILNSCISDGEVDNEKLYPSVIIACCYDVKTGKKLFNESDVSWLMEKNASAIELLAQKAIELSGLTGATVKGLEKN